jgi:hypothetical protein
MIDAKTLEFIKTTLNESQQEHHYLPGHHAANVEHCRRILNREIKIQKNLKLLGQTAEQEHKIQ